MKALTATAVLAMAWLTGCALPEGYEDPNVSASYLCASIATPRAVPNPELGARQTKFTVIGQFTDTAAAAEATQSLRAAVQELFARRAEHNGTGPLVLADHGGLEVPPHLIDGLENVDNSVTQLGLTVFLRAEGKRALDPIALVDLMASLGGETLVEVPGNRRTMNVDVVWHTSDPQLDRALSEEIGHYLATPFELMPVAPWAPVDITPEQAAVRRDFHAIRQFAYDIPAEQRVADAETLIAAAQRGDREGFRRIHAEQEKRSLERLDRRVREFLETHPEVDPGLVAGFLQWSTTFDIPKRYQLAAKLGEKMGQLSYSTDEDSQRILKNDPLEAYSGLGGLQEVSPTDKRLQASFIAKDIAVGLPALVDHLCRRGVDEVSYTITDFSAYM